MEGRRAPGKVRRRSSAALDQPEHLHLAGFDRRVVRDGGAVDEDRRLVEAKPRRAEHVPVGRIVGQVEFVCVAVDHVDTDAHGRHEADGRYQRGGVTGRGAGVPGVFNYGRRLPPSMSEATPEERGREVWIEKYRPQTLDEIKGQGRIVDRLQSYIESDDLPHLLFAGPAGIGKCVTGETPVLTNEGLAQIEDIVGEEDGFAQPTDDIHVLTLDDRGKFDYVSPSHTFSKRADDLLQVGTRDGSSMTVTPEHRLLVLNSAGFAWKTADSLDAGDRIARPLEAPLPDGHEELDWLSAMDGERTFVEVIDTFAREHDIPAEEDHVGKKRQVVAGLRAGHEISAIAESAGTTRKTVQHYRRQLSEVDLDEPSTTCSLEYLRELDVSRETLREHVRSIRYVTRYNHRSPPIRPPWEVTPDLATFVGLAVSEARIEDSRIKFYNTDEQLLDAFERTASEVFGLAVERGEQHGVPYRIVSSRTLVQFLRSCFGVVGDEGIGSGLLHADAQSRRAFLRAVFDAEGHVTEEGIVELTQRDGDLITLLSYLLAGIGVPSRRKREHKTATNGDGKQREYHTLYVSGSSALARFDERVGFGIDRKASRLRANTAREGNPNHDTVPVQQAVDNLCRALNLDKSSYVPPASDRGTSGRERYLAAVDRLADAASERVEAAQEVLGTLDRLDIRVDEAAGLPAAWAGGRSALTPVQTRRAIADETGIRSDRLLEYADGRRTPRARRAGLLLQEAGELDAVPATEPVQTALYDAVERLGVSYEQLADGTHLRGSDVGNLLTNEDREVASMARFGTVAERVRTVASRMLGDEVVTALSILDRLASADLYFDEVASVEPVDGDRRVYDLTVPETHNYVAGRVPTVVHNTTAATAIARELYGEEWRENFLELNASDERGIDVVRDRIKNFARASFGGYNYRIIFLDEADALTSEAQSALRRTMEQFSNNTRFILSCNYSSQIIDPIQSRCAVFRFSPLGDEAVAEEIRHIAETEGIDLTEDGVEALVYAADGDMRKAINGLQAAATTGDVVDEEAVFAITSTARPEEIEAMVHSALDGEFAAARGQLDELLTEAGIAGGDIIDQLHRSVWEFDLDDEAAVRVMDRIGEADYRITTGANEQIQLEALLASLARDR